MTLADAEATPGVNPVVAILILSAMAGVLVVVFARTFASAHRSRGKLRHCPVCHGDALRDVRDERISDVSSQVSLQCGECSTWRRMVTNHADLVWEVKALDRDRQVICAEIEQLELPERQLVTRDGHATAAVRASHAKGRAPATRTRQR
ncbi:hypothetical protein OM076_01525 [Solirubrobacter ginsenosidimutans]|uniref:Uncharacterized protein n=1 Tax=Solirubrobacter ginsenosidimutans TaxID=490573 RepID=A0A9X3MPL4_9ACTN|nr:hypothetical protein [Solirubrobacter ginsenosidimutans]MDA0158928.1 hypothetical protein [Solirubrobacter ginsenosidimutans]